MRKKHFTKHVGVLLSEETYAQLIEATNKAEVTYSNFIRKMIEENFKKIQEKENGHEREQ